MTNAKRLASKHVRAAVALIFNRAKGNNKSLTLNTKELATVYNKLWLAIRRLEAW